jgi:hypothetical protein
VPYWIDIAGETAGETALATGLEAGRGRIFLLLESSAFGKEADPRPIQAAVGPLVSSLLAPISAAMPVGRLLEAALGAANRGVHDLLLRNPTLEGTLVSATVVLVSQRMWHVASVGGNAAILQTSEGTHFLAEPENEANKLIREGITADPLPTSEGEETSTPSAGLGLAPEFFCVRQNRTLPEPRLGLLLLCGARAVDHFGPAHVATIPLKAGESRAARRLYGQVEKRLEGPSAILAALTTPDEEAPASRQGRPGLEALPDDRPPPHRTLAAWLVALGLALAGAAYFLGAPLLCGKAEPDPAPPPASLLGGDK